MEARHTFVKGRSGFGIFYRVEDFIVFITIVSVLVRSMDLTVLAFCPMFNHAHFLFKDAGLPAIRSFIRRMAVIFVKEYNREYGRQGPLFQKRFGSSLKKAVKIVLGTVAYVFNNPVAGRLCKTAKEYRWNLLAYHKCRNPFSKTLRKESARHQMRVALKKVDYLHSKGRFLSYQALSGIFGKLLKEEKQQAIDYILAKYNFLSFDSLEILYGSHDRMLLALDSNAGSEFEIEDEYGDHSCYRSMLSLVKRLGYKDRGLNFEKLNAEEIIDLFRRIRSVTKAPSSNIRKFLHLQPDEEKP